MLKQGMIVKLVYRSHATGNVKWRDELASVEIDENENGVVTLKNLKYGFVTDTNINSTTHDLIPISSIYNTLISL